MAGIGMRKQTAHFNCVLMTLAIICAHNVQATDREEGSSIDVSSISENFVTSRLVRAVEYLTFWNTLNLAIDEFAREYQLRHKTSVEFTRQLKRRDRTVYPCKEDRASLAVVLEFSYLENGNRHQSSVIVEIPSLGIYYIETPTGTHVVEKYMYQVMLPKMYQSWPHERLSPDFYASKNSENLIIENLHSSSYFLKDSLLNSVEECELVFKSLAQFHALSIANLSANQYNFLLTLSPSEKNVQRGTTTASLVEHLTSYKMHLLSLPMPVNMNNEIKEVLDDVRSIYIHRNLPNEKLNVLLHGSLRPMAVYFGRDNGSQGIMGCKFVDFRASISGPPVLDLMNYFMTGVEIEVFKVHQDSLFGFYLGEFHKTLAELNHSVQYDLKDLQADLRRYKRYFILNLLYKIPVVRAGHVPVTVDEVCEVYNSALRSNEYLAELKNWMEVFLTW